MILPTIPTNAEGPPRATAARSGSDLLREIRSLFTLVAFISLSAKIGSISGDTVFLLITISSQLFSLVYGKKTDYLRNILSDNYRFIDPWND